MPTEQQQFEQIALPHLAALLRVARRLTFDPASAEDLVQETMLLAWRGFQGFEPGTNVRAWLFRILFNAFYGEGRRAQRAQEWMSQRPASHSPASTVVDAKVQEAVEIAEMILAELPSGVALVLQRAGDRQELVRHADRRAGEADF